MGKAPENRRQALRAAKPKVDAAPLEHAIEVMGGIDEVRPVLEWGWEQYAAGQIDLNTIAFALSGARGMWTKLYEAWAKRPTPKGSSSSVPDEVDGVPLTDAERRAFELELRTADWGHACRRLRWAREERGA